MRKKCLCSKENPRKITGKKPICVAEAEVHGQPNQRKFFGKHYMRKKCLYSKENPRKKSLENKKQKPELSAEAEVHSKPNQRTFFGKHHMRNTFEVLAKSYLDQINKAIRN